jgi:Sulfotransferase domain
LPDFRFDKISDIARGARAILSPGGGAAVPGVEQPEDPKNAGQGTSERRKTRSKRREFARALRVKIRSKKAELSRIKKAAGAATGRAEAIELKGRKKRVQQEIFELERELRAFKERRAEDQDPVTGTLPDFVVIGAMKGGTSYFYHLLTQHPLVEPCAKKELHFFDLLFEEESVEWYRRCFPTPGWIDGRRTITGEATPYMPVRNAPKRMAEVVPEARLIALLRNPVERTYSDYQQVVRKGRETRYFEEAIEREIATRNYGYLSKSIYVDHLPRWSEFFPREQMLVLKSEDFFDNPRQSLKTVFSFLGLPEWEVQVPEPRDTRDKDKYERNKRNKGTYKEEMAPATRRRLEAFFEPHNKRLYEYLGVDFGW